MSNALRLGAKNIGKLNLFLSIEQAWIKSGLLPSMATGDVNDKVVI